VRAVVGPQLPTGRERRLEVYLRPKGPKGVEVGSLGTEGNLGRMRTHRPEGDIGKEGQRCRAVTARVQG